MTEHSPIAPAVPSATILLLRDGSHGIEVLMQQRSQTLGAFAGMLTFPGGKIGPEDYSPEMCARTRGIANDTPELAANKIGAIREAFEECGVLLARDRHGRTVDATAEARDGHFAEFVLQRDLTLAGDLLVPFAHWITPEFAARRFDTWFFLAPFPGAQVALHDGGEMDDTIWTTPAAAIAAADAKQRSLMFTTRANLMRLAESQTIEQALARARVSKTPSVMPVRHETATGPVLRIPAEAGYSLTEMTLAAAAGQ
ncbi:MAG: NUDIX domain-containing protein [Alphaproteobacteria bacterium]